MLSDSDRLLLEKCDAVGASRDVLAWNMGLTAAELEDVAAGRRDAPPDFGFWADLMFRAEVAASEARMRVVTESIAQWGIP